MDTSIHKTNNGMYHLPRLPSSALPYQPPTTPLPLPIAPSSTASPYPPKPSLFLEPAKNQRVNCSFQQLHTPNHLRHPADKNLISQYDNHTDLDFSTLLNLFPLPPSYIPHYAAKRLPVCHRPPPTARPRPLAYRNMAFNVIDMEQALSDFEDSEDEFTCLPDPTWSDTCPWEQEPDPTKLSSKNYNRLMAMDRAFDVVYQCEWMKNIPRIEPERTDLSDISDLNVVVNDRSPDSTQVLLLNLPDNCSFPVNPKALAPNHEPTPSQYLMPEIAKFPDVALADSERDDEVNPQQPDSVKIPLSYKKSTRKTKAKGDHPLTQYTMRPQGNHANVPRTQKVKGSVSRTAPSRVQYLISLFEEPLLVPFGSSESISNPDSIYESYGRLGYTFDSNRTSALAPSALAKTSPETDSIIHDDSNSVIPFQTLHIPPKTETEQLPTTFYVPKNIALHRQNSHLAFLATIHRKPVVPHKLHWDAIGDFGYQSTVPRLWSFSRFKAFNNSDDKVFTQLGVSSCCTGCGRCTSSAYPCQQYTHQLPDPAPRPPPRPLTPYPRPTRPSPRPVRLRPSPRPRPDALLAAYLSFGRDTVFDSMSSLDSDSDAALTDIFEFFHQIETVDLFPAPNIIPLMSREQVLQITAKAQTLDDAIRSLLVQLDNFLNHSQTSEDLNVESEPRSPDQPVEGDLTKHPRSPQMLPLHPIPDEPLLTPPSTLPSRGDVPSHQFTRGIGLRVSTAEETLISDTPIMTDVNNTHDTPSLRMQVLPINLQGWTRAENMPLLSKSSNNGGSSYRALDVDPARLSNEHSFVHSPDQSLQLCQAVVSQLLQLHKKMHTKGLYGYNGGG